MDWRHEQAFSGNVYNTFLDLEAPIPLMLSLTSVSLPTPQLVTV